MAEIQEGRCSEKVGDFLKITQLTIDEASIQTTRSITRSIY